jgi:L-iditol 2-dehydrogenase
MQMQVAMLYGPQDVRFESVAVPEPGPGEVLVNVKVALTDGTDMKTYMRGGHVMLGGKMPSPFGHEFAGVVEKVGPGVTRFRTGMSVVAANSAPCLQCFYCLHNQYSLCEDLLFLNGAYAQYLLIPARIVNVNLHKIPVDVSFTHAAMSEPLACVVHGIDVCDIRLGDTVVVNGAGAIGLMLCRLATLRGARVIACDPFADRLEIARRFGATAGVQVSDGIDQVAAVKALTDEGRGADVAIEAVGLPSLWEKTVSMTRKGGLALMFGGAPHGTSMAVDTAFLHYGEITIKGVFHHTPRIVKNALDLIAHRQIDIDALIGETMPLSRLPDAIAGMAARKAFKYALVPGE